MITTLKSRLSFTLAAAAALGLPLREVLAHAAQLAGGLEPG